LQVASNARADRRALVKSAVLGSALGLTLGVAYLSAGLGQVAAERGQVARVALGPKAGFAAVPASAQVASQLRGVQPADPDALRVAAAKPGRARELTCLTQAVYFEARGESVRGQQAVATVIMNRVKNPNFPKTVCGVVYQGAAHRNGCQFSFACDGQAERVVEHTAWDRARSVAARALSGAVLRDIGSATHFHATGVDPEWGSRMLRVAQVGLHVFYRFNPHAPKIANDAEGGDDNVDFVSLTVPSVPALRLAQALGGPASEAKAPAPVADAKPAPDPKPADPAPAASPVSKTDTPVTPKPQALTTS
jgi:hypothetical protein